MEPSADTLTDNNTTAANSPSASQETRNSCAIGNDDVEDVQPGLRDECDPSDDEAAPTFGPPTTIASAISAGSLILGKRTEFLSIDREAFTQDPNKSATSLVDTLLQSRISVEIDERLGMAAAFKAVLLNVISDAATFGDCLSQVAQAQGQNCFYISQAFNRLFLLQAMPTDDWRDLLAREYESAFPSLSQEPVSHSRKKQKVVTSLGDTSASSMPRRKSSGTTAKQVLKNFDQLYNKLESLLGLAVFQPLAPAIAELSQDISIGMKYAVILNKLTREFNGICEDLYRSRCDGKLGRSLKVLSFGVSLLLETVKWLNFYVQDHKGKKPPKGYSSKRHIEDYLLGLRGKGVAYGPLLTPQEHLKEKERKDNAAEDARNLQVSEEEEASDSAADSKGKGKGKGKKKRTTRDFPEMDPQIFRLKDGEFKGYLPLEVLRVFCESKRISVDGEGVTVIDLTNNSDSEDNDEALLCCFAACPSNNFKLLETLKVFPPIILNYWKRRKSLPTLSRGSAASTLPSFAPVQSFYSDVAPPSTPLRQIQEAGRVYSTSRKAISKRRTHCKKSSAEKRDIREKQRERMRELRVATGFTQRAANIRQTDSERHREVYNAKLLAERNAAVYSDEELATIDDNYQFGLQSSVKDLYTKCAQRLSFAAMTKHCCIVCDCNYTKNELTYSSPSLEYLNLRKSLWVAETVVNSLDPLLVSQYDVSKFDVKLSKLFLSQNGFYFKENNILHPVTLLSDESEELVYQQLPGKWHMPAEAIANGNWIGRLPAKFGNVSRTTENVVSLMQPCIYLSSIFGHGSDSNTRNINSHHYILKNSAPVLRSVPASIGSTFRFTFVGAWTPLEIAEQKTRYKCQDFVYELLEFFEAHHSGYKEHNYLVNKHRGENELEGGG
ncbi:hypothetical protein BDR26DRAFT_904500 [Obelidium mucronatum]|nr:hypothetical protein BDR26DRAFT_904500 [Obelidium mucronatum]